MSGPDERESELKELLNKANRLLQEAISICL
jgi:hypothetical protein